MSLFGSSPTQSPLANSSLNSKSLFGDEVTPAATSTSSLFADDNSDPSPWLMPTPKKAARRDPVKTLLQSTDVPESYVDAYDKTLAWGDRVGAGIGLTEIKKILESSRLNPTVQAQVLNLVLPGGQESGSGLGRSEFNVLLALIGLGQEGEDVTLDGVDERRRSEPSPLYLDVMCSEAAAGLPIPRISYLDKAGPARSEQSNGTTSHMPNPSRPRNAPKDSSASRPQQIRQDSLGGDLESDPWGTPRVQKSVPQSTAAHNPRPNGLPDHAGKSTVASLPQRTTSTFTTHAESPSESNSQPIGGVSGGVAGWSSYNGSSNEGFSEQQSLIGGGFGDGSGSQGNPGSQDPRRSVGASTVLPHASGEVVTVTMLPEKEGMFMFQHRNYEVKSVRRSSSVVRRYSDFVWLLDCLQKRYPFRRLPLLPPKRVQVNGTHLAADATSFLEKRRRGLVRFANALVQHPVLSQEQLVVMFLTVPTYQELSVWRKQATISVQEEFVSKSLPANLEDSLPPTLIEIFDTVRAGVKRSAEIYISLCTLLERLAKRNEGLAADNLRFSLALQTLTESTADTYAMDTNDVPLLNEGINATAKHLSTSQSLLEDEARAWDEGVLEDLKRQRDCLVGMRDMFDRRDRYARDNIPQLERRIEASENKLQQLRQKPQGAVKPGEIEKVESSIISDKESIVQQHARGVLIKECIRDEIIFFQQSQYLVSKLHQDWSQERVKYAELQASNWRALSEEVENMPLGG